MSTTEKVRRPVGRPPNQELQQRRRTEILSAATNLFAERGYIESEVQDIADRAGVGKGTVYRYYPSKDELFLAASRHGMDMLNKAVETAACPAERPLDRIATGVRAYLEFFEANPNLVELLILERVHFRERTKSIYFEHFDENLIRWQSTFEELAREGVLRDLPVERMIEFVSEVVYGAMFTTHFSGRRGDLGIGHDNIVDLIFRGILRCPGT
ncbi:MAG: TetR/AcrR family transcriptional regulator [Planctomycetaceae bacterium]|nr:MAG: TetR/AcrR family transcriptional regulator [Planctomycetaceae bacterium]